jgi:MoxR-like ATPase
MSDTQAIENLVKQYQSLKNEIHKVIVGQEDVVDQVLISIFSKGHCLLVGVPGLAKTLLVNTIAQTLGLTFNRIQFTPDLMPSDIIGAEILDENRNFKFIKGPLFSNIILADEINRTPPKTQSALLEAMQERSVTAGGTNYKLPAPFFVLATQNPIEQEGTYPLPEAQLDRFMFNVWVDYPSFAEEMAIVKSTTTNHVVTLNSVISGDAPKLTKDFLTWGAGPRASQYLILGAKTHAAIHGKFSPDIEDVKAIAKPILRHRLVRNYRAEAEGYSMDKIIEELL